MYIYTPLCRYWIALYRYVLVFIVPHVDIKLEDNKQFILNIPRNFVWRLGLNDCDCWRLEGLAGCFGLLKVVGAG